ncbi:hypothetical protein [Amycolatopsis sp. NPDC052450]|uniref:hypothetical protein n=1 Tax=Amycolatopsis sp. NPDC052450 TaxID=3363937 RepID=UPI0037C8D74C
MAASAPRKTTTRKTAPRKSTPPKPKADLGVVLDDAEAQAEIDALIADREPLFTIDGVTYTIPKRVPPSWSLQAYRIAVEQGSAASLHFAAEKLLTPEAWNALVECETVTESKMRTVLDALVDRILPEVVLGPKA